MSLDRIVQLIAALLLVTAVACAGSMLPGILKKSEESGLRYTNVAVEGAPPIVALGTAIGALRGVIVDYLWIKLNMMKEKGLYYEIMADAELITQLQPRFGEVWAFLGHNMAYNISVVTNTPQERWEWVKAGIDLVRNRGIRANPHNLVLHKELAFWLAHKVEYTSDDAHLYYKREFGREWHFLLGPPPYAWDERIAWMKTIADAPLTLEEAEARTPGVQALVERLQTELSPYERRFKFELNGKALQAYGWAASVTTSPYARILGVHETLRAKDPIYNAFHAIINDPAIAPQRETFIAFLRKKVLLKEYFMDPQLMYEFTRDIGPIEWRHGQGHALFWAARGTREAEDRYMTDDDIYKVVNNDRYQIQAMQGLANDGLVNLDPFSDDLSPSRLPDLRWIKIVSKYFRELYAKHNPTRGAGGDTFIDFYENFMSNAIRQLYRAGDLAGAQEILTDLDNRFGRGGLIPNTKYARPLDVFVQEVTYEEYENVPAVAITDALQALRRGFHEGILLDKPELLRDALKFAADVRDYFQHTRYADYENKFGVGRVKELIDDLNGIVENAYVGLMLDTSVPLLDRLEIFAKSNEEYKRMAYDFARPQIEAELAASPLGQRLKITDVLPEPPGMEAYRVAKAARIQREKEEEASRSQTTFQRE
jgi:hypothetical protein